MVTVSRLFTLSLISLPFVVLYAELANRVQESAATMQLRQEVGNLRFRLDYETSRLQRMIDDLQRQVRQRVQPPVSTAPLPALRPVPSEVSATSARRLRVHDAAGRPRGAITVSDRFGPMVALMGRSGDVEAMLSVPPARRHRQRPPATTDYDRAPECARSRPRTTRSCCRDGT